MRRRSDRKKTPEVSSSPAPATRRSGRRSRKNVSPSPEKSDHDSGSEKEEVLPQKTTTRSRRRSSSAQESSPVKRGRIELNKIVEENGQTENEEPVLEKSMELDKSTEEIEIPVPTEVVKEKEPDSPKKEASPAPKEIEEKVRSTDKKHNEEIESTTESEVPEKQRSSTEKSPSKASSRRSKDRHSSGERSRKDKGRKNKEKESQEQSQEEKATSTLEEEHVPVVETPKEKEETAEVNGVDKKEEKEKEHKSKPISVKDKKDKDKTEEKGVKKRKWISRKSSENKIMAISTDSLKTLISDPVHPVPLSDVHLDSSPEIEVVHNETITEHDDSSRFHYSKDVKKSPEPIKSSREVELEEGEEPSEEEEGQIERGEKMTSAKTNTSSILYITNLVRPFTVMQLKGLLSRTGKIVENGFWIDRIKSKCYVRFENEDEAVETRHALHGVRWPTSNPKCLNVEFGTEEAMNQMLVTSSDDAPKYGNESNKDNRLVGVGWDGNGFEDERKVIRQQVREWDMGKREEFHRERNRERLQEDHKDRKEADKNNPFRETDKEEERVRERRRRSPSYERHHRNRSTSPVRKIKKENEPPLRLLDDLFRKTKTTPCVYWLPLTPEQIMEKEQRRLKRVQDIEEQRRERDKREKEREKQRELEREQRRRNRSNDRERDRNRDRSRDDRRDDRRRSRSRDRDRRRY